MMVSALLMSFCLGGLVACSGYLDVVPDGVATMDNAFSNRINAEKFLFTCYNRLPNQNAEWDYPGNVGGDEIWWDIDYADLGNKSGSRIATNSQNITTPYQNYWDGNEGGEPLWQGIRDCNIFLENIDRVPDMEEGERLRWISEVKFIKAYLHFFLLELYGPIPIVDVNLEVNSDPEEVRVKRRPVEEVIEFVVNLLDESMENLPGRITETSTEMGRITKPIAASIKAKALVWAASPLFNGNPDYVNFKDKEGTQLIPSQKDDSKWGRAAEAIKEAIDISEANGHALYQYQPGFEQISEVTRMKYTLRGVACERPINNPEIIWAHTEGGNGFQNYCTPKLHVSYYGTSELSAPLKIAEQYYTMNGVPIDEDTQWDYTNRYETRRDTGSFHQYYIKAGETTAMLNYYREPRFYAHVAADQCYFRLGTTVNHNMLVEAYQGARFGTQEGIINSNVPQNLSGYWIKKGLYSDVPLTNYYSSVTGREEPFVVFRLADLYLMIAEAWNEYLDAPDEEHVYQYIDAVRERAGIPDVVTAWTTYSNNPGKVTTQEGMREIIHREWDVEFAFEARRFWNLRRWLDAEEVLNADLLGWNILGSDADAFYNYYEGPVPVWTKRGFTAPRDYLFPIRSEEILISGCVQNPGW